MDHGETWSGKRRSFGEINKMVIFRENRFLKKKGLLTIFNKHLFRGKRFKRDFLQKTDLWEKDLKAYFSFNKGFRCFRKYIQRVMKSYKILLIFLHQRLQSFQTKFY